MKEFYPVNPFQKTRRFLKTSSLKACYIAMILLLITPLAVKAQQINTILEGDQQISLQGVSPFSTAVKNQRSQYLYTGDLLQNLEISSGYITSVAVKVTNMPLPTTLQPENLQIKMGLTAMVTLPEDLIPDLPVHYSSAIESITATGWYTFNLTTPLYWDGYSNIVMEFCRTNVMSGASFEVEVYVGLTGEYRTSGLINNLENGNGCSLEGITSISLPNRRLLPSMRIGTFNPCESNPAPGTVIVSSGNNYCGEPFTLSVIDDSYASGLSYQWQYSFNNGTDFINIPGATAPTLTTSQSFSTYYRRGIMCDALEVMIYNGGIVVEGPGCFCNPTVTTVDATGITNVSIGSINSTSSSEPSYTDFRIQSTNVHLLETVELSARVSTTSLPVYTKAWIDWNHDGIFAANEAYELGVLNSGTDLSSGNIASFLVPADAMLGNTVMRVRTASVADMASLEPCGNTLNGESEDYTLSVMPELGIVDASVLKNSLVIFAANKSVNVRSTVQNIKSIKIFDISGRLLYVTELLNEKQISIPLSAIAPQILIVEAKMESGLTINKKVNLK